MPRSPSRDRADRFDGNRGYFRRPEALRRAKSALAVAALVLTGVWVVADVVDPARTAYSHAHGPLANPHAVWESDCAACHRPHSVSEVGLGSIFHARDRWHDLTCEKCHAGPAHNANVADTARDFHARCSNCHHDHAGRANSLVRISDGHCTRCHADLAAYRGAGTPNCAATVTNFATDHPEFRPLAVPPIRTLKFSHALHMTPGQVHAENGREAMTATRLRELSGPTADGYRAVGPGDDRIQLDCASCHRLDSGAGTPEFDRLRATQAAGEPGRAAFPPRAPGAHFLPVNFEAHCRACHPLRAPAGASGGNVIPGFDVPHRRQPPALRRELGAGYLRGLAEKDLALLAVPAGPGGLPDPRPAAGVRTVREEVDRLTSVAAKALASAGGTCAKCHDLDESGIAPVPDRAVWLLAAHFDHTAHRALACASCHPGTAAGYAPPGTALVEKEPVQITGIDSCRACHSPAGTRVVSPDGSAVTGGGVRHACTDCHRYHNGDHGLQGRGAAVQFPAAPLGVAEFLRGKKDRP
jgi:hypothetical protein